jgi:hypothetical protein
MAGVVATIAFAEADQHNHTYTVSTDFETAQRVVVGERVERIRTDESGVHIERHRDTSRGQLAGATVVRVRGEADAVEPETVEVRVRADRSLRIEPNTEAPQPLIYMDGERFEGDLSDIDPEDIERVEVVKGAAAIELFGEAADGGVVQIFMKNQSAGNPGR